MVILTDCGRLKSHEANTRCGKPVDAGFVNTVIGQGFGHRYVLTWGDHHDFDRLPGEVDMEELYVFRFDAKTGSGLQRIYNDSRSLDTVVPVCHSKAALPPEGYRPVVNAPGYTMYHLWIMAGRMGDP